MFQDVRLHEVQDFTLTSQLFEGEDEVMELIWRECHKFIDVTLEYDSLYLLQIVSTLVWSKVQLAPMVVDFEYEKQLLQIESCEGFLCIFEQLQVLSVQNLGKSPCSLLVI